MTAAVGAAARFPILAAVDAAAAVAGAPYDERPPSWSHPAAGNAVDDLRNAMIVVNGVEVIREWLATFNGRGYFTVLRVDGVQVWASRSMRPGQARAIHGQVYVHPDDVSTLRAAVIGREVAREAFAPPIPLYEYPLRSAEQQAVDDEWRMSFRHMPMVTDPRGALTRLVTGL